MLRVLKNSGEKYCEILHSEHVFHDALQKVKQGEINFHVINKSGEDYELSYIANQDFLIEELGAMTAKMIGDVLMEYPYLDYNENDIDNICMDFLRQFNKAEFLGIDEYSVVAAKLMLEHTDIDVFFTDERIFDFISKTPRLHIVSSVTEKKENTTLRVVDDRAVVGLRNEDFTFISADCLFHNLFFLQGMTDKPISEMKYLELHFVKSTGIGGILAIYSQMSQGFGKLGITTYLDSASTRFSETFLTSHFNITKKPVDACESNTIELLSIVPIKVTWYNDQFKENFDDSILTKRTKDEMNEYAEAIFADKKILGILARGTDYITSNRQGARLHATVEQMTPMIHQWMEEDQYDLLFLATEDKDIYKKMKDEFGDKLRIVAQERHSINEFKTGKLIYDLEKEQHQGDDYKSSVIDTTINYFYALYLLSKCDAFICSGMCNGWDTVNSFNKGKFKKIYKFAVGISEKATGGNVKNT